VLGLFLRPTPIIPPPREVPGIAGYVEAIKPILPIPALLVILPLLWLFFRDTWREIDEDALKQRAAMLAKGKMDRRPLVALVLCSLILTMQEYYGGRGYFDQIIYPWLAKKDAGGALHLARFDELYGFGWWAVTRVFGYTLPFWVWKIFFREDKILDFGLRTRGFFDHAWIYGLFIAIVIPAMFIVSASPDFGSYYPFYKTAHRSWVDFLIWEVLYFAQFLALEMFFRGFWIGALRKSFGSGAIFAMAVPYCMIHFGKPYLEAVGAVIAGIALGSLAMKTRSIYQGFLVHITVAVMMDWLSLRHRKCTPLAFWPTQGTTSCLDMAAEREALARSVEHAFTAAFVVMVVVVVGIVIRQRRARARAI